MTETPFYRTRMGAQYYDRSVPQLIEQIARLADAVEALVASRQVQDEDDDAGPSSNPSPDEQAR